MTVDKDKYLERLAMELKIPHKRSLEELGVLSKVVKLEVLVQQVRELVNGFGNNKQTLEGG